MLLGEVLQRLADEAFAAETLLALGDLPLMVAVEAAGRARGESGPAYAAIAVRRFAVGASDEDWLALMAAIERAADPGVACLRRMLDWSLHRDDAEIEGGCRSGSCTCGRS